jgi:hypothetical protein
MSRASTFSCQSAVELVEIQAREPTDVLATDAVGLDVLCPPTVFQQGFGRSASGLLIAEVLVEQFAQGVATGSMGAGVNLGEQPGCLELNNFGIALCAWSLRLGADGPGKLAVLAGGGIAAPCRDRDLEDPGERSRILGMWSRYPLGGPFGIRYGMEVR